MTEQTKRPRAGPPRPRCLETGLLTGKTAWITGGGTGIGRAMALRFPELGARLAVSGRRREPLEQTVDQIRAAGGEAACATCATPMRWTLR